MLLLLLLTLLVVPVISSLVACAIDWVMICDICSRVHGDEVRYIARGRSLPTRRRFLPMVCRPVDSVIKIST